ncbi:unnamed protein product [Musa acuminata subsp. burmannicoides]
MTSLSYVEDEIPHVEKKTCYRQGDDGDAPRHPSTIASQKHGLVDRPAVGGDEARQEQLRELLVEEPLRRRSPRDPYHQGAQSPTHHLLHWLRTSFRFFGPSPRNAGLAGSQNTDFHPSQWSR